MAEEKWWADTAEELCAECGEGNYAESRVPGICIDCCTIGKVNLDLDSHLHLQEDRSLNR